MIALAFVLILLGGFCLGYACGREVSKVKDRLDGFRAGYNLAVHRILMGKDTTHERE